MDFKFKKVPQSGILTGTLAGLAYCVEMPVWLIRFVFFTCLFINPFAPVIFYVVMCVFSKEYETIPLDFKEKTKY